MKLSRTRLTAGLMLLLVLLLSGCAGQQVPQTPSDQARAQYEKGMELFEDKNYLEAINALNVVRTRFPYSNYATLAELKIADAHFEQGKHIEAAAAYRTFIRLHPHHPQRAYSMYRVGECFYEQIPGDWWFMPPAHERELTSTQDALRELESFTRSYPDNELIPEADKRIESLKRRLAEHELFVARFYWKAQRPRGTVMRTEYLLAHYPVAGMREQALLLNADAHRQLGENELARTSLLRLVQDYPGSSEAGQARSRLAELPPQPAAPAAPVVEVSPPGPEADPPSPGEPEPPATALP